MRFTKPLLLLALSTGTMVSPAEASIGKAAELACELFCQGIADLFVNIFGKRGLEGLSPEEVEKMKRAVMERAPQTAPEGVPQFEFERCYEAVQGVTVTASSPAAGAIQFDNVPAYCMNLATVLVGDPVNGPYPTPCGSACLVYNDLSDAQFNQLVGALNAAAS
ncbi:hypothetical protein MKZ38_002372 [Zalerion maritima]|uniref:Uncharacterized protein n=1 Tax=Zalerion maritima TaxID=339359 RepID=A0AAD5WXC4_9PEZI|nr:hypothetical protein MKZ38_002372 [Zalerion maritima]